MAGGSDVVSGLFGTETLDLSDGSDAQSCRGVSYPYQNTFPVAVAHPDGSPVVCGGEAAGDECLKLDAAAGVWEAAPSML